MLDCHGITLDYGGSRILNGIDLRADTGAVTCVLGTNGVGKTSLLKAISGTHPRSGGSIALDGHAIGRLPAHAMARRRVGYVPQGRDIFPLLTVRENLETGFAALSRDALRVPDEIYELFPVLWEMRDRRGGDLSGGQQQQLAIGRALVMQPKLLLLDEPTEGIQPSVIRQIGRVIDRLRNESGMAILLVEQYFDFAWELANSVYVMQRGQISIAGSKRDLERGELIAAMSVEPNAS